MLVISSPILMIEACSTVFKMSLSWGVEIIKLSSVESFTWSFTYLLQILAAWCPHTEVLKECNFLYIKVEVLIFLANLFSKKWHIFAFNTCIKMSSYWGVKRIQQSCIEIKSFQWNWLIYIKYLCLDVPILRCSNNAIVLILRLKW